ncbi:MAG: sigma-70 family RNA polymerase sigma factor [Phycisphaerales bacterium]|nr:sigma-70 family RNA polymerase sigma factor [Phycisphaerales bacterium]
MPKSVTNRPIATRQNPESCEPLKVRRSASSIVFGSTRLPAGSFSPRERATLEALQASEVEFVDNPQFHRAGALRRIFDEPAAIAPPDVSWYRPLLDERPLAPTRDRTPRTSKSVVLTAAQERTIFAQLNFARFRVADLRRRALRTELTTARAREMLVWHATAERVRKQIAEANLGLVLAMSKRVRSAELDFGDLMSEGNMALMRSVDKFDFGRGFKFSTYGCRAILKAYSRLGLKTQKYRQHFPVEFDPELERADQAGDLRAKRANDDLQEVKDLFHSNRAGLSEIERTVIFHRYGLDRPIHAATLTLEQVGLIVGVTKERVRQIQNKALEKIRLAMISMSPSLARSLPTIAGFQN